MQSIVGIFAGRESAETAATALRMPEIAGDRVSTLTPDMSRRDVVARVPTDEGEAPGVGPTLGGVVGLAAGASGGMQLATAAAVTLFPFVGPVIVTGLLAGALLGAGAGVAIGKALEDHLPGGLPKDELYVYEQALRRGRSVVIALVESDEQARRGREVLARGGAETVDEARAAWGVGVTEPAPARGEGSQTESPADRGESRVTETSRERRPR
jgi:hypothetical protein